MFLVDAHDAIVLEVSHALGSTVRDPPIPAHLSCLHGTRSARRYIDDKIAGVQM